MILRPALIGFAIAAIVASAFLLLPRRTADTDIERAALPPALFPIFPGPESTMESLPRALVAIRKTPLASDVAPGSPLTFRLRIENVSGDTLKNLTVEDRFDDSLISVTDAGEGVVTENRIIWRIPTLQPDTIWEADYTMELPTNAPPGHLETTAYVYGEDLADMSSGSRLITSGITVIAMPKAGVAHARSLAIGYRILVVLTTSVAVGACALFLRPRATT